MSFDGLLAELRLKSSFAGTPNSSQAPSQNLQNIQESRSLSRSALLRMTIEYVILLSIPRCH
jgi:hypothetical protein